MVSAFGIIFSLNSVYSPSEMLFLGSIVITLLSAEDTVHGDTGLVGAVDGGVSGAKALGIV